MGNIIISKLMVIIILILIYLIVAKSLVFMLPFIIGWLISVIIEPLVILLNKKLKIYRGIASFISVIAFLVVGGLLISSLGGVLISELTRLSDRLPDITVKTNELITYIDTKLEPFYINILPNTRASISDSLYNLFNSLIRYIGVLGTSTMNFLTAIPNFMLFLLFTLLSAFFISKDKREIYKFIRAHIPDRLLRSEKIKILRDDLLLAILGYIKAQLILMVITFILSVVGLALIGVNYSILIALVISIIDAVPVLGAGSVYIPWIIVKFLQNNYNMAIFLLILYLTVTIVRQTLQPKILSTQIGLYPLVTLMSIYIGIRVFGFFGIILGPLIVISILALQKVGLLPNWNNKNRVEK